VSEDRTPSAALRARVLAQVASTPAPTRANYERRVVVTTAVAALATIALFLVTGGLRPGGRPVEMIVATVGFGLLAAAVLTRLSSGGPHSMLGRPRAVLLAAVAVTAPLLAAAVLCVSQMWPATAAGYVGGGTDLSCAGLTLLQGALPLGALVFAKRGSDPVHPAVTGAALGMTAGAWAVVMAYLRCPHAAAMHCIVAHVLPTLILAALGAGLGALFLRVRRERASKA
jgi:hypothetical protein